MDNEVTKLYKNAGIEPTPLFSTRYGYEEGNYIMPPFTAEKQLELIKWLAITRAILIKQNRIFVGFETGNPKDLKCAEDLDLNFEKTLAGLINNLWQDLTEEEKQQVKEILE